MALKKSDYKNFNTLTLTTVLNSSSHKRDP
jgi:hypothetical protein